MSNFFKHTDTIAEIDLNRIAQNTRLIREFLGDKVAFAAVVKADAYGHGAVTLAPVLIKNGADLLACATIAEALELRKAHPDYPILVMGNTPDRYLQYALEYHIRISIDSLTQARKLQQAAAYAHKPAIIHIKYDTGFHRLGFPDHPGSINSISEICNMDYIQTEGFFSHLALTSGEENEIQYKRFMSAIKALEEAGCYFRYQHLADSISAVDYPKYHLNMVRIGALLYGLKGFHKGYLPVTQALTLKTKISHITALSAGEGISYDYVWRAPKNTRVGTLPIGYADGYPRSLSGRSTVSICGKMAPVIGVICMDQCIVDLSDIPEAGIGSEAILYGDGNNNTLTIADISLLAGTNKNDIVSRLGRRVYKKYIQSERNN